MEEPEAQPEEQPQEPVEEPEALAEAPAEPEAVALTLTDETTGAVAQVTVITAAPEQVTLRVTESDLEAGLYVSLAEEDRALAYDIGLAGGEDLTLVSLDSLTFPVPGDFDGTPALWQLTLQDGGISAAALENQPENGRWQLESFGTWILVDHREKAEEAEEPEEAAEPEEISEPEEPAAAEAAEPFPQEKESGEAAQPVATSGKITQEAREGGYRVVAVYDEDAGLENAELRVRRVTRESDPEAFEAYVNGSRATLGDDTVTEDNVVLMDIGFWADGEEIKPKTPVQLTIEPEEAAPGLTGDMVHFGEEGTEAMETEASAEGLTTELAGRP